MYQIYSVAPSVLKLKNILHIVDTREMDQGFKDLVAKYPCEAHLIFKLGETHMSIHRFREFPCVMVHDTSTPYRFWDLLKRSGFSELLKEVALDKSKTYVGFGNGAALLQKQMTYFKGDLNITATDLHTPQIGVEPRRLLFHYRHAKENALQIRQILDHSRQESIYCFPDGTGYISSTDTVIGEPYLVKAGKTYKIQNDTTLGPRLITPVI